MLKSSTLSNKAEKALPTPPLPLGIAFSRYSRGLLVRCTYLLGTLGLDSPARMTLYVLIRACVDR